MKTLKHPGGHEGITSLRSGVLFGLAALGLALATPVQAGPNRMDDAFIVARRDHGNDVPQDRRDVRSRDERSDGYGRRAPKREAEYEEPEGYGYGYERRQRGGFEEDGPRRGRR